MDALPARLIAHIFTSQKTSHQAAATLRAQLAQICADRGTDLVDLIFDTETPSRRLRDYPSLVRIARGEADGIVLARMPSAFETPKSRDRLCAVLEGSTSIMLLTTEELRTRRLLPARPTPRAAAKHRQTHTVEQDIGEPTATNA